MTDRLNIREAEAWAKEELRLHDRYGCQAHHDVVRCSCAKTASNFLTLLTAYREAVEALERVAGHYDRAERIAGGSGHQFINGTKVAHDMRVLCSAVLAKARSESMRAGYRQTMGRLIAGQIREAVREERKALRKALVVLQEELLDLALGFSIDHPGDPRILYQRESAGVRAAIAVLDARDAEEGQ